MTKETMLRTLVRYATKDLHHKCRGGTGLLSALVNLVDTARENPDKFVGQQWQREIEITEFLFGHDEDGVAHGYSDEMLALQAKFVKALADAGHVPSACCTDEELGIWKPIIDELLYAVRGLSYEQAAVQRAQALLHGLAAITMFLTDLDNPIGLGAGHRGE